MNLKKVKCLKGIGLTNICSWCKWSMVKGAFTRTGQLLENTINRQSTKKKIQLSVTKSTEARKDVGITKRPHALKPEKYSLSDESVYGVRSLGTAQRHMLCDKLRKFQMMTINVWILAIKSREKHMPFHLLILKIKTPRWNHEGRF